MTALSQYQIVISDPVAGAVTEIFDGVSIFNLRYSRALNDVGQIALLLPSTATTRALFPLDTFIEVYRTNTSGLMVLEETYLARTTQRYREGDDEYFLVGGFALEHFLARRIVDPRDDPAATADGFSAKSGASDTVLYNYALQQIGPSASTLRQLPGLSVAFVNGVGAQVSERRRFDNLLKVFQEVNQKGLMDWDIVRGAGATFTLNIARLGKESRMSTNYPYGPWVGLNPYRANLASPSLLIDRNSEQNFIYAMAQGKGNTRALYTMAAYGLADSPYNRIEFYKDIRQVDPTDAVGMQTAAVAALEEKKYKREFTFDATGTEAGNTYRLDWDIGDYVTVMWDEYQTDLRMTGTELEVNDSGESIKVTVQPIIANAQ